MRKILFILSVLLFAQVSLSQLVQPKTTPLFMQQGSSTTWSQVNGLLYPVVGFVHSSYTDTTSANVNSYVDLTPGTMIRTIVDNQTWVRNQTATAWLRYARGSDITSVTGCNTLLQGGIVTWAGSGLIFDVSPATYFIDCGGPYSSAQSQVTLAAADPSNPRFDVIYADVNGAVGVITGTASANPEKPQIDPTTQIELTFIRVDAGSTTPPLVTVENIFDENLGTPLEWLGSAVGMAVDFNNLVAPFHLLKAASTGAIAAGNSLTFTNNVDVTLTDYTALKFYIRLKATFAQNCQLNLSWYEDGVRVSTGAVVSNNNFGFVRTTINTYQVITIPISAWNFTQSDVDALVINITGSNASGFYIDWIQLQAGIPTGGGGGNGTLTSLSVSGLSPLFTTVVLNPTTTPAVTYTLSNAAGGTVFGNATGSSAAPSFTATPILGIPGTTLGTLRLAGNISGTLTVRPPATITSWTLTTPANDGDAGQFLQTDGSGTTSWAAATAATPGIDDVLAVAQALTNNRSVTGAFGLTLSNKHPSLGYALSLENDDSPFSVENTNGGTTNVVNTGVFKRSTAGIADNEIGLQHFFAIEDAGGSVTQTGAFLHRLTNASAGAEVGRFEWSLINGGANAIKMTLAGTGALRLHNYGIGTFTGTPAYTLQVDASGNIIEGSSFGAYAFSNLLTESPAGTVKAGGTATANTTYTMGAFTLTINATNNALVVNSTNQNAIYGNSDGSGAGVVGVSVSGYAGSFGRFVSATNTVANVLKIDHGTVGTPAAGFGVAANFTLQTTTTTAVVANEIVSKWTDATHATRTSQFIITGVNAGVIADKLVIEGDGRIYGTGLHNSANAVTGTTNQYLASGTFTPTLFNTTNIAASTAYECNWLRVGNVVTVSGKVDIDVTLGIASELGMSLPIASGFTADENCGGTASSAAAASLVSAIRADAANDRAAFVFVAVSVTNDSYTFEFTYVIK